VSVAVRNTHPPTAPKPGINRPSVLFAWGKITKDVKHTKSYNNFGSSLKIYYYIKNKYKIYRINIYKIL